MVAMPNIPDLGGIRISEGWVLQTRQRVSGLRFPNLLGFKVQDLEQL